MIASSMRRKSLGLSLALLAALQCAVRPTTAQESTLSSYEANPKCPSMKIADYVTYIFTEAATEFELPLSLQAGQDFADKLGTTPELLLGRAQQMWDDYTRFEFARTKRSEVEDGDDFPFVMCVQDADGGGDEYESYLRPASASGEVEEPERRKSGYDRSNLIREAVSAAAAKLALPDFGDREANDLKLKSLYNERGGYCAIALLPGSVAEAVEYEGCLVQPMIMPTKVAGGTVELATKLLERYNNFTDLDVEEGLNSGMMDIALDDSFSGGEGDEGGTFPSATLTLCPGALTDKDIERIRNGSTEESIRVTQLMTEGLLSRTESGEETALKIVDNLYWTSADGAAAGGGETTSSRGELWGEIFDAVSEKDACAFTFTTSLEWFLEPGDDAGEYSSLHVRYNNTGEKSEEFNEIGNYCVLAMIAGLAIRPDVCFFEINPEKSVQSPATNVQWLTQSGFKDEAPWLDGGLDGTGQIVAVSDTGIDINNCYFWDKNVEVPGPDHRKIVSYNPGVADSTDYQGGHGTHVAGIIVGKKSKDGINEDDDGKGDGVAPGARVAFLDNVAGKDGYAYLPDAELLATGREDGTTNKAHIHSASWSSLGWNFYSAQSRSFDDYIYKNDDLLVVMAAGNGGRYDVTPSVASPSTAKNVMTVGASHSSGGDLTSAMLGSHYVADFSGKGPTIDGRIAPDVVAAGKFILAAGAQPDQTGECDPSDGSVPEVGYNKLKGGLKYDAGTSMSTPVVSGAAALILQYFQEGWYPAGVKSSGESISPTAALVKAILMNGAQNKIIQGVDNGKGGVTAVKPYDGNQGFGRIDLTTSLYVKGKSTVQAEIWDNQTASDGDQKTYTVTIDKSAGCESKQLSATLAWFEEGSSSNCLQCLLNDLDLYVTKNGDETIKYYPNGKSQKDSANTVERVVVDGVVAGDTFTLHVVADNLSKESQKFALVSTGCFGGAKSKYGEGFVDILSAEEESKTENGNTTEIIIIVVSVVAGIAVVTLGALLIRKRRGQKAQASS